MKKILFFSLIILVSFYFIGQNIIKGDSFNSIRNFITPSQKEHIKTILYPQIKIQQLKKDNETLKFENYRLNKLVKNISKPYIFDEYLKENLVDLNFTSSDLIRLNDNVIKVFEPMGDKLMFGSSYNVIPGSAYLEINDNDFYLISKSGIIGYTELENLKKENFHFSQIKNNIEKFLSPELMKTSSQFNINDALIYNDHLYISFTNEIYDECFNTGIIYAHLNKEFLNFDYFFSPTECIHAKENKDQEFYPIQSGGRMIILDNNNLLLTTGDYRERYKAQDEKSVFGKVLRIGLNSKNYSIVSMGHRNPQGITLSKDSKYAITTEHGPMGGDEINIIELNDTIVDNFGWPFSSYGEHYGGKVDSNKKKYEKYPLYKSHKKFGYLEPLKSFQPAIGPSEIISYKKNFYLMSTLRDKSLYFIEISKKKIKSIKRHEVKQRIRDLKYHENTVYIYFESTGSIGILNLG